MPKTASTSRRSTPPLASPTVQAWELGLRLRERREEVGMTAVGAGRASGITQAYISGVEAGRVKLPRDRLAQLVKAYELDPSDAAELEELRVAAMERAWWHQYSQLFPADFLRFLGYEAGAEHVRSYHNELLHGLLQTEEYARAVIRGGNTYVRLTEMDRRVAVRMARQRRLDGDHPLRLTAVITEGALRQQVGGAQVMRSQLDHLDRLLTERAEQFEVRVMPFAAGAHPALGGPFQILSFPSPRLPDLVWQEVLTSSDIIDQSSRVADYVVTFAEARERALSSAESLVLIRRIAKEMT
ncbi:helix-turn-helix transcriptional regulator [Micromonospora sp. WMMD1128]|uniref:helix-turn-helix domain-containing protein n=1 Tax=unclassified Micromonospora TaxID=2617518 RepID=UPI00248ACF8F|nr:MULTISPECIES: helix-turn-helix transcriptional regulator [unclassified Micromonospora]WBB75575.1 helix-turn-helix transcriptional regulator [Micromonospora sp. WMMD1128]WFE31033.1 helix-turn-helix transcriptional regulator [Micromonospora sp. WMMD975]